MFYSGVSPLTSMHEKYKSEVLYGKKDGLRREAAMVIDEYTNMEYVFDEEESVNMCEGVQGMIDDAVEEALEKENMALVENIRHLMKNMNWTAQQAVEAMEFTEEKKQIVLKKL